jgi:8-oxo-dGTP pyrophosphatase MutT (NUDIX family)
VRELPNGLAMPAALVERDGPPATPRHAATVMLIRDSTAGIEVFLMRRVLGMAFAGGMTVFPGGGVDQRDADASIAWHGPEPAWWAARFGCSESLARAQVCAAVRETFEESGVLLAGPDSDGVVSDARPYAAARQRLVSRELSLAGFLADNGLVLRADLLRPWANWVTPEAESKRFDAAFFLAELPAGQRADGETSEAQDAGWQRPADALEDWKQGRSRLVPPTWATLTELAECGSVADAMSRDRVIAKITPKVVRDDGGLRVVLPGDPAYDDAPAHLDARPGDELRRQ